LLLWFGLGLDVLLLSLILDLFLGFAAVIIVLGDFDECLSDMLEMKGDGDGNGDGDGH
jgi:hypothetical protein